MNIPRLVVILDRAGCRLPMSEVAIAAVQGGADQIQLREPDLDDDSYRRMAIELIEAGILADRLTINGHPKFAIELGANLHLPERMLGTNAGSGFSGLLSTSVHAETLFPVPGNFDYLIAGNVLPTASHPGRPGLGVDGLRKIVDSTNLPVLVIGGIGPETIAPFFVAGADGVAVRSYIVGSANPEENTHKIREELDQWTK